MDPRVLHIFEGEAAVQCRFIDAAAVDLAEAMGQRDLDEVWRHLQSILAAAANLSKLFWSSGGKRAKQREPLRLSLRVRDDSPLRDTNVRNAFEHFDERLETWAGRPDAWPFVGRNVGPRRRLRRSRHSGAVVSAL